MPHGTPDWWGQEPSETIYPVQDAGELAVRLDSIVTFDRRGNVFHLDDFENGITGWGRLIPGTGGGIYPSAAYSRNGAYSMKMVTPTDAGFEEEAFYTTVYRAGGGLAFEISFVVHTNTDHLRFVITVYDGANYHRAGIEYDHTNTQLEYFNASQVWTVFDSSVELTDQPGIFHTIKLVFDMDTGRYERLLIDALDWDLAAYSYYNPVNTAPPYIDIWLDHVAVDNTQPAIYFDDLILTHNEP